MFLTRASYRSPIAATFAGSDEQMWDATELPLQQIWFLVCFQVKDEDGHWFSSTVLVTDFQMVEPFVRTEDEGNTRLSSVHIVTPGHVNSHGDWQMERLFAVLQGHEISSGEAMPIDIFETVSGNRFPATFCKLAAEDLAGDFTLKFLLP